MGLGLLGAFVIVERGSLRCAKREEKRREEKMELDDEMPPKEDSIQAFIGYLVEPTLNKIGRFEAPSPSAHEQVAKQMQAVVLLYNYYLRKQFPQLEFLDALTFCKTAVVMCAKLITYMGILKGTGTNQSASEFVQRATITEKMVKEACDTCEALDSPRTMSDINTLPVSKIAVFIVDAAYQRCILIFGSITRGVWSLVEKDVDCFDSIHGVTLESANQNKEKVLRKRPHGDMPSGIRDNGTAINEPKNLLPLAFLAVKEQTGLDKGDLQVAGLSLVYSLTKAKTSSQLYMMRCTNDTPLKSASDTECKWVPVEEALSNVEGPLLENVQCSYETASAVSYFHLRPYSDAINDWLSRKDSINVDGISEAFDSAQYIKGQNSVASNNQDRLAQSYRINSTKPETMVPNVACTNDELVNTEAYFQQDPIDTGKAVKSGSQQFGTAADVGRRKTINVSKFSQKPLSPMKGKPNAIEKVILTTKGVGDAGKAARQSSEKYLHSMQHANTATEHISSPSRSGLLNRSDMAGGEETHIPLSFAAFGRPCNNKSNGMQMWNLQQNFVNHTIGDREKFSNGMQENWISSDGDLLKAAIAVISEKRDKLFEDLIMGQSQHQSQSKKLLSKIAECDANMKMILCGGKDAMILAKEIQQKTPSIGPKVAINDMKRRKLSEGILFLRSSSQELSDICVKNQWSIPSYFVSIPSDSYAKECFYATVKIRGYDFELEESGELNRLEMEAKESAASLMLSRLYRMSASSRE